MDKSDFVNSAQTLVLVNATKDVIRLHLSQFLSEATVAPRTEVPSIRSPGAKRFEDGLRSVLRSTASISIFVQDFIACKLLKVQHEFKTETPTHTNLLT